MLFIVFTDLVPVDVAAIEECVLFVFQRHQGQFHLDCLVVAVSAIIDNLAVLHAFMECRRAYNQVKHVQVGRACDSGSVTSPSAISWSVRFAFEKGVSDAEAMCEVKCE